MTKKKYVVHMIKEVIVELDTSVITEEWLTEFGHSMFNVNEEELVVHIANQFDLRGEKFAEGVGSSSEGHFDVKLNDEWSEVEEL